MKIILTSEFHKVADKLLGQWHLSPVKTKVAFIQNATDTRQDRGEIITWVEDAKERYSNNGFTLDIIDLRIIQYKDLRSKLSEYKYLHIHGGDNKHLHAVCKQSWLTEIIHELLDNGLIYIGSSAWSIIAWPDMNYSIATSTNYQSWLSKEEVGSINFKWFWLHPFYLIPHAGKADRLPVVLERVKYCEEQKLSPLITYNDQQAIIIENGKFELIW